MSHIYEMNPLHLIPTQPLCQSIDYPPGTIGNMILASGYDINQCIDIFEYDGNFSIVNGHHRVLACVWAGLSKIPCNIKSIEELCSDLLCTECEILEFRLLIDTELAEFFDYTIELIRVRS